MKKMSDKKDFVLITLTDCVTGTTTSSEGLGLFLALDKAIKSRKKVKLSLHKATPLSSSFMNSSFGEIYDKYGYETLKRNIVLVNYLPSYAKAIKDYLTKLNKLVK